MAKYGGFIYYPNETDPVNTNWELAKTYGGGVIPSLSVEPFTALVVDYNQVNLSWLNPQGAFRRFRLLRNQSGVSDTEEDGIILIDRITTSAGRDSFVDTGLAADGTVVPIVAGKHVYYSIWVWLSGAGTDNQWYPAGRTYSTVPSPHSTLASTGIESTTHTRMLEALPKVFTTHEMNAFGETDYDSDLARFLEGFSFTADQVLTLMDLLLPNSEFTNFTPELLDSYAVNFGLAPEYQQENTNYKRKFLSNAIDLFSTKGTIHSLENYLESVTNFSTKVTESPNLMLTAQDATFYKGKGSWYSADATSVASEVVTIADVPGAGQATTAELAYRVDNVYRGKVITNGNATLTNGALTPLTSGIPVKADRAYYFAFYQKSTATATMTLTVNWHDYLGNVLSGESVSSDAQSVTTAWSKLELYSALAPANAVFASLQVDILAAAGTKTFYIDMVQFNQVGDTEFREARGIGIDILPTKVNYIGNPSFEEDTDGWSATNATLTTAAYSDNEIPGQESGLSYMVVDPTGTANVKLKTTSNAVVSEGGDFAFSTFFRSATLPAGGITVTAEAYAVEPYTNYIDTPTPTTDPTTGWTFDSNGTYTQEFYASGGPSSGDPYTALEYTVSPTSGDVSITVDATGITPNLVDGAEYTFAIWVKMNTATTVFPAVSWTVDGGTVDVDGDNVTIEANQWTRIEFTTVSVSSATAVDVTLITATADADDDITLFAVSDAQFFPVTYTSTTVFDGNDGEWVRGEAILTVPQDVVIPVTVGALDVDITLAFTSSVNVWIDAAQLERGFKSTDYFDGSFFNAQWAGGASLSNDAPSNMYANKTSRLAYLQAHIREYLPIGCPFYVATDNGVEFGGFFKDYA